MSRPTYVVACLARHGIGPEVMAEASRAVDAASRLHGFLVDERHVPFGADAMMRFGHPFPLSSRRAVLGADAVLVASEGDEALATLEDELDLRAAVVRVRFGEHAELSLFSPLRDEAWPWTLERGFSFARESRARIALMGVDTRWATEAAAIEDRHAGLEVDRMTASEAVRALVVAPAQFDVVVCAPEVAATAADLAASLAEGRTAAWGRLAPTGPSVFGATHGAAEDIAGQGVADPSSMLLAAALMLGEGLGERSAAATLASAVGRAGWDRTSASTRGQADVVLAQLPLALANAEFYREAVGS
jgi:isocitrate/isopropylmalate dehydrogenase